MPTIHYSSVKTTAPAPTQLTDPSDAHIHPKSLERKRLHKVSFALTACVENCTILDLAINHLSSNPLAGAQA
jgi:hypothetical protein